MGLRLWGVRDNLFPMEKQMDSDTLSIAVFVVVALIVIAAGVYVMRPEKKT